MAYKDMERCHQGNAKLHWDTTKHLIRMAKISFKSTSVDEDAEQLVFQYTAGGNAKQFGSVL